MPDYSSNFNSPFLNKQPDTSAAQGQQYGTSSQDGMNNQGGSSGGQPPMRKLVKRKAKVESKKIGCPKCAGPIDVKNYTMSDMVTCSYCGAVLDLSGDKDKVVRQVLLQNRPPAILKLGAMGRIKGTFYEVIGRIQYRGFDDGETYYYDEYLLFNPKNGYGWLQEDEGSWTFLKKLRNKPDIDAKTARVGQTFVSAGTTYRVAEVGSATVNYVEGEFTYHIEKNDRVGFVDATAGSRKTSVSVEITKNEIEWLSGTNIPGLTIGSAFNVKVPPAKPTATGGYGALSGSSGVTEIKSSSSEFLGFGLSGWTTIFSFVALCFTIIAFSFSGVRVLKETVAFNKWYKPKATTTTTVESPAAQTKSFEITQASIVEIKFRAPVKNAWVWIEIEILDVNGETIHVYSENISYYSGYDWSEGSQTASTCMYFSRAGRYTLSISGEGGKGSYTKVPPKIPVYCSVVEDVIMIRYFLMLLLACSLPLLVPAIFTAMMEAN